MKIWMNGCFDILHYGHFLMIEYASSLGSLKIGIDSDHRVKEMKGTDRPFHSQTERLYNLKSVKGVDSAHIFNTDAELTELIRLYKPDIFIIGSDYKDKPIIGGKYAKEIRYFNRIKEFSTTQILDSI